MDLVKKTLYYRVINLQEIEDVIKEQEKQDWVLTERNQVIDDSSSYFKEAFFIVDLTFVNQRWKGIY